MRSEIDEVVCFRLVVFAFAWGRHVMSFSSLCKYSIASRQVVMSETVCGVGGE